MISFFDILSIFFLIFAITPIIQHQLIELQRFRVTRKIETQRNSRVILLIHRLEIFSFLGIPFSQFINIEDSESVLRAIRLTNPDVPIDFIIHTPGGLVLAAEQIAKGLVNHPAPVTIFIPHYAMSGGTLIALAGDKIAMDQNAVLGPLDPQIGEYPATSILATVAKKPLKNTDDKTLILADIAKKGLKQVNITICEILSMNKISKDKAKQIANILSSGKWTHDYPIQYEEAKHMGLPVEIGLPIEIYDLMELYPQFNSRRPSVYYIPVPYQNPDSPKRPQGRQ